MTLEKASLELARQARGLEDCAPESFTDKEYQRQRKLVREEIQVALMQLAAVQALGSRGESP